MLHVHRAERADRLADGLAATLLEPLNDPFAPEIVAVPTRGIERWLTQRLSTLLGTSDGRRDGVCANVEFPFPARLIQSALAAATGIDPDTDPWVAERSVWPLLEVVDECLAEPWLATLARHLEGARGNAEDPMRRFGAVRHIAELFDRYSVQRPDLVRAWERGDQTGDWQSELWRRLRERIDAPSPAERLAPACVRIREDPGLLDLPARLSLFGLTRIPRSYLQALAAIADQRDLHLFVLHPSPALWKKVAEELQTGPPIKSRHDDRTATAPANRLLASWGRDVRELQLVLASAGEGSDHHHDLPAAESHTLLTRIQADVREDRQPPGAPLPGEPDLRPALDEDDRTIQIHACHGRARQVEVLRDVVLHLLEDDPTLEPRDVIVMCPDIETFAPLIQATFGPGRHADRGRKTRRERTTTTTSGRPTSASGSPTARCARPIRCSASSASCSRSPTSARPRHSCSTWPGVIRSAGASASTTTTCRGCRSGSPRVASDGASTRSTASRSSSARSRPTRGGGASIGCWSASR